MRETGIEQDRALLSAMWKDCDRDPTRQELIKGKLARFPDELLPHLVEYLQNSAKPLPCEYLRKLSRELPLTTVMLEMQRLRIVVFVYLEKQSLRDIDLCLSILRIFDAAANDLLDFTEDRHHQDEIMRAKDAAENANQAKSAFLATMSHEIRTPLSAILGFSDLLLAGRGTPEKRVKFLETIVRNGRGLMMIIDDILDLSKVEAGRLDLEKLRFPLKTLLDEVIDLFAAKAQLKGIFLRLNLDQNVPENINSDPTRIKQVLANLVSNAVKFTDVGGVEISLRAGERRGVQQQLTFAVKDSGVGLTQEQQGRLFRAFSQADNSTTRRFGGTGLGLYLAKRLAQALGGDIYLQESAFGAGCTFVFEFLSDVSMLSHRPETKDPDPLMKESRLPLSGVRILVAEDACDNQLLIRTILCSCGAAVEVANNGGEAVDAAMRESFDVILMDLQMPVMDGYEATRTLRKSGYVKPIIALTAHAMMEERVRTREAGCNYHLTKPLNVPELIETINRSIDEQNKSN